MQTGLDSFHWIYTGKLDAQIFPISDHITEDGQEEKSGVNIIFMEDTCRQPSKKIFSWSFNYK